MSSAPDRTPAGDEPGAAAGSVRARRRRPAGRGARVHWPSVRGRAWAGRGPLLLSALVIALATLLATAVPAAMRRTADDAVADAVSRAGGDGAVSVEAPFEAEDPNARVRRSGSAAAVSDIAEQARFRLGPVLADALGPPVPAVTSSLLPVIGPGNRQFRLAYVGAPRVVWTAGTAPGPSVPASEADTPVPAGPWTVHIGLSEADAAALHVGPGDRLGLRDPRGQPIDVRVTGVFRALDPADPTWRVAPLLRPGPGGGLTAGLMSAGSLPDGRLVLLPDDIHPTVTFAPRPDRLRWRDAATIGTAVVALKASSGQDQRWTSNLDTVLAAVRARVTAAGAQAAVLLVGLVTAAALVLLLAADLLVRRRAAVLAQARVRGASLPGLAAELTVESAAVAVAAVALGSVAVAGVGALPVLAVAVLAGPVLGVREAARAVPSKAVPANRTARRTRERTRQLRRLVLEAVVVLAAAGAFATLKQRGISADAGALPAAAPTLGAAVGALVLLRLLPPAAGWAITTATRSRRGLPLLGAARVAATAGRPLPFLVLVVSTTLLTYAVVLEATERPGPGGPLADGLRELAAVSAVVLLAFAVLGVVLGAAATAPARGETLARLRTLGLRPSEARQVAVAELLPPVLAGGVGAVALGLALAYASIGLLDLDRLTGGTTLVIPPVTVVPVALLVVTVVAVVTVESARHRRERLGLVLRV